MPNFVLNPPAADMGCDLSVDTLFPSMMISPNADIGMDVVFTAISGVNYTLLPGPVDIGMDVVSGGQTLGPANADM